MDTNPIHGGGHYQGCLLNVMMQFFSCTKRQTTPSKGNSIWAAADSDM